MNSLYIVRSKEFEKIIIFLAERTILVWTLKTTKDLHWKNDFIERTILQNDRSVRKWTK